MNKQITHIRLSDGNGHEHITDVKWSQGASTGQSTRAEMVSWIESGNTSTVTVGASSVNVGVVNATPKYIRTYADRTWTDNLLSLPKF